MGIFHDQVIWAVLLKDYRQGKTIINNNTLTHHKQMKQYQKWNMKLLNKCIAFNKIQKIMNVAVLFDKQK